MASYDLKAAGIALIVYYVLTGLGSFTGISAQKQKEANQANRLQTQPQEQRRGSAGYGGGGGGSRGGAAVSGYPLAWFHNHPSREIRVQWAVDLTPKLLSYSYGHHYPLARMSWLHALVWAMRGWS